MKLQFCLNVFTLLHLFHIAHFTELKPFYRRPVCEYSQSCSYDYLQLTFALCDCPLNKPCSMDNGVEIKGITYQFCYPRQLPDCEPFQIAASIENLQTSIYCTCPVGSMYIKEKSLESSSSTFVCKKEE